MAVSHQAMHGVHRTIIMAKTLQEFLDGYADLVELAAGGRVAGFFRRTPTGLRLLDVNVMLAPDPSMCPSLDFCHEDATLIAVDRWVDRAAMAGFLDSLRRERIVLQVLSESANLGRLSDWSVRWLDRPIARQNEGLEWPIHMAMAYSAELTGQHLAPITERWRRRLPLWTPSFRDMATLCRVLGVKNPLYDSHTAAFCFYLPVPARIECVERTLEPAGIRVDVRNHGLEPDYLQISVVSDRNNNSLLTSLATFEAVDGQGGVWRSILKWDAPGLADVLLAYKGEWIDRGARLACLTY